MKRKNPSFIKPRTLKIILGVSLAIIVLVCALWFVYLKVIQKTIYSLSLVNPEVVSLEKVNLSSTVLKQNHVLKNLKIATGDYSYLLFEEVEITNSLFSTEKQINFPKPFYHVDKELGSQFNHIVKFKLNDDTKISFKLGMAGFDTLNISSSGLKVYDRKNKEIYSVAANGFTISYQYGDNTVFDLRHGSVVTKSAGVLDSYAKSGNIYLKTSTKKDNASISFVDFYASAKDYVYEDDDRKAEKANKNNLLILGKVRIRKDKNGFDIRKISTELLKHKNSNQGMSDLVRAMKFIKGVDLVMQNFDYVNSSFAVKLSGSAAYNIDGSFKVSSKLGIENPKNLRDGVVGIATLIDGHNIRTVTKDIDDVFTMGRFIASKHSQSSDTHYVYDIKARDDFASAKVNGYPVLKLLLSVPR